MSTTEKVNAFTAIERREQALRDGMPVVLLPPGMPLMEGRKVVGMAMLGMKRADDPPTVVLATITDEEYVARVGERDESP